MVEGITDEILFKKIYESEFDKNTDGIEWVSISGKNNYNNYKKVLDALKIKNFYIGDFDNVYDIPGIRCLFEPDERKQEKDLKKKKNQSYACLDLLKSIESFICCKSDDNLNLLIENYNLYTERFLKLKDDCSEENNVLISSAIENMYKDNIYILKKGEIEDYLGTGNSNKTKGFLKVISMLNDSTCYEEFKRTPDFNELLNIISLIYNEINERKSEND